MSANPATTSDFTGEFVAMQWVLASGALRREDPTAIEEEIDYEMNRRKLEAAAKESRRRNRAQLRAISTKNGAPARRPGVSPEWDD